MVCIPCFVIPAFLWLYYRFLRPYMGPVMDKLEQWFYPYIARFLPQTCPIKPPIKNKSEDKKEKQDISIDSQEKLKEAVEAGGFGKSPTELRNRPRIVPVVSAFDDQD